MAAMIRSQLQVAAVSNGSAAALVLGVSSWLTKLTGTAPPGTEHTSSRQSAYSTSLEHHLERLTCRLLRSCASLQLPASTRTKKMLVSNFRGGPQRKANTGAEAAGSIPHQHTQTHAQACNRKESLQKDVGTSGTDPGQLNKAAVT